MIWFEELQTRKKISRLYSAYEKTFPADERRDKEQFLTLIEKPDCYIFGVNLEEKLVGYLILWELETCHFLEHFEVFEEFRNLKLGEKILTELKEKMNRIVLETEPRNLNEMTARRIGFYERNGFSVIDENYVQPSYGEGKNALQLFLLSNFDVESTSQIVEEIYSKVYEQ
jgi:ribosomal protein S18 acetylase RimI-like enzyme